MSSSFDPLQWRWFSQQDASQDAFRVNNVQSLIDAARLEGIRLGLEAAKTHLTEGGWIPEIGDLDPATIAKDAKPPA